MPRLYPTLMISAAIIAIIILTVPSANKAATEKYNQFQEWRTGFPGEILPYSDQTVFPLKRCSVCSGYGDRIDPITNMPAFHNGIDLCASEGMAVMSVKDGNIVKIEMDNPTSGNWVEVQHSDGTFTRYLHLSKIGNIRLEDHVGTGSVIGAVGSTGRSTGPHLHFEVRDKDGNAVDPNTVLDFGEVGWWQQKTKLFG